MCCILVFPLWRYVVCCDDWLQIHLKKYHPTLFECVVRSILPAMASARTVCSCLTYFCLIGPVECYRCWTCRDPAAYHKCMLDVWATVFKQLDLFDVEEITDAMGTMPDWKRYMKTGEWPWDDEQDESEEDDDDE
ncbi:hypothetical protein AHF37_04660 [Paragonimus kellicotti]|nr:hypothetical protein AHF37_04660 [Paragonimus kellicotti]